MYHYVSLCIIIDIAFCSVYIFGFLHPIFLAVKFLFFDLILGGDLSIDHQRIGMDRQERGFLGQTCTAHRFAY